MRVSVDNGRCEAQGQCNAIDPDLYTLDDDGYSTIGKDKAVPAGSEDLAREGAASCPMAALTVDE